VYKCTLTERKNDDIYAPFMPLTVSNICRRCLPSCRLVSTLLMLLVAAVGFGQAPAWQFVFGGRVTEYNEKKAKDVPLENCIVSIFKGGNQQQVVNTGSSGKFKLRLDPNGDYEVRVTKSGYITKKFTITTFNVPSERGEGLFADFDVEIELFKIFPGLDYSVLNKPVAKIIYNPSPEVSDFDYDKVYTNQMRAELEKLKELARQAREKQKLYDAAIERADKAFGARDWNGAKSAYQEALGILPNEQYPKDKIAECDKNIGLDAVAAAAEKQYKDAIAAADAKFASKDWAGAKADYQKASGMKPAEQYPKDQISKCDAAATAAANAQRYKDLITDADAKFAAKNWAAAKAKYQEASALNAAEKYPKDQIVLCDKNIADEAKAAAKEQQYKDAITAADAKFAAKDWAGAKTEYTKASGIKPTEQYPKDRIKACDDNISAEKSAAEKNKKYNDAIADADAKFTAKDWSAAKAKYQEASGLKPEEKYPKDRIAECDKNIAGDQASAAKDKSYKDALAAADAKFASKDWAGAKVEYTKASGIKPEEQYPKDKIKQCDDNIAADKANADKAAKDKQYSDAIAAADAKFAAKDWVGAKVEYTKASGIKPEEEYPKDKIKQCDDNIAAEKANADKAAKEKQYKDAIAAADAKFAAKDWAGAKVEYTKASGIKPEEEYPKDKIKQCDDNIAADKANADKAAKDKQYNDAIAAADAKFGAKDWAGAKVEYTKASGIKPEEQYPKDKIKQCDDNIAADKALADNEKKYTAAIAKADAAFKAKDYNTAKSSYTEASGIKPAEQYPKDKIAEIEKILAEQAANDVVQKKYNELIKDADTKFTAKDWAGAKALYQQASDVKPAEQYPKDRMKACDDNIAKDAASAAKEEEYKDAIAAADKKFEGKDWNGAKVDYQKASGIKQSEKYPKDQIVKCDANIKADADAAAKEQQYKDAIAAGDSKFAASDWGAAKAEYSKASGLKPSEQYPKDKMAECDSKMASMKSAELDKKYNDAIAAADEKFGTKDWAGAKSKYQEASALKASEQYPKDKIAECDKNIAADKSLADAAKKYTAAIAKGDAAFKAKDYNTAKSAYTEASGLKPAEQYPKDKIAEIDALLADKAAAGALNKEYNDLIKQADTKFTAKDWSGARGMYEQASNKKPAEQYPKDRMKACDDKMASEMGAAENEKRYKAAIARGDSAMTVKDYETAQTAYTNATGLKPTEQYPKTKLAEINKILADMNKARELDANYKRSIARADSLLNLKLYNDAKAQYNAALKLKTAEQYPKDKIAEIDAILAAQIGAEKDKQYTNIIAAADAKFGTSDWSGAKAEYQKASALKPTETYPKDQIAKCDKNLADLKASADRDKKYTDAVARGDKALGIKDYNAAKAAFTEATNLKPEEQYPKDKLAEIDRILGDKAAADAITKKYNDLIKQADSKFTAKDWSGAKRLYVEASGVKPDEQYPKDRIKECDDNIAKSAGDAVLNARYKGIIASADSAFTAKNYEVARDRYNDALGVKPAETYPKTRIAEIDKILAAEKAASSKDQAYRDQLHKADSLFGLKDYLNAKKEYQGASLKKPADQYPKDKIAECDKAIADQKLEEAKNKKYNDLIAKADKQFAAKDWKGAKSSYQAALIEKPMELYPKKQIIECDKQLNPKLVVKDEPKPENKPGSDEYVNELVLKYPQGLTVEESKESNVTTEKRVVVVGNKAWVYTKKVYSWGTFYFKDGAQISENTFRYETSPQYIQQQQAEYDKTKGK
jgi:hypothetical protein